METRDRKNRLEENLYPSAIPLSSPYSHPPLLPYAATFSGPSPGNIRKIARRDI